MRVVLSRIALILVLCLAVLPSPVVTADAPSLLAPVTVSFQQGVNGYAGNRNAVIDAWHPGTNLSTPLVVIPLRPGVSTGLMRFDLSSLPTNAYVHAATLRVYVLDRTNTASNIELQAYRLRRGWVSQQTNWYRATVNQEWGRVGVNDTYVDRDAVPSASVYVSTVGRYYELDVTTLVREWVHTPAANNGLLMTAQANASVQYRLIGDSYPTVDWRPKLTVTYSISADNDFPPSIRFVNPLHDRFVRGDQPLAVNVQDDRGISRVEYFLDGRPLVAATASPYRAVWNVPSATPGTHRLTARAYDTAGQTAEQSILVHAYRMDQGVLTFAHISDVHLGTPWQGEPRDPNVHTQRFVQALRELNTVVKPAVIINTGDSVNLADTYSCQLYAGIVATSTIPIKTIPGNHDLSNQDNYLYYIGPWKQSFDLGLNRFVGFTTTKMDQPWLQTQVASSARKSIIFSHYLLRLPQGSTAEPWFFLLPAGEKLFLQNLMKAYQAPAYLSGHYHSDFTLEDNVSHAVEFGAPALGQKGAYLISTVDNGVVSSKVHYLNDWPEVVITRPRQYVADGGSSSISGTVTINAKVFGDAPITSVSFAVDGGGFAAMTSLGANVWRSQWNSGTVAPGLHSITVRATDSRGRTRSSTITVRVVMAP